MTTSCQSPAAASPSSSADGAPPLLGLPAATAVAHVAPPLFSTSTAPTGRGVGVVGWYIASLEARPVLTKSLTAAATADVSSQMITFCPKDSLDLIRTLPMASYGLLLSGPSLHLWFNFVSKILPKKDLVNTFNKMFLGQAVYGPIMTSVFFLYNAALQGETAPEIIARLKRDLIPTFKSGSSAGEQFLLVSLDCLHHVHGQLAESRCGCGRSPKLNDSM